MLHADVHGVAIMNIHNQMQTNTYTVKKIQQPCDKYCFCVSRHGREVFNVVILKISPIWRSDTHSYHGNSKCGLILQVPGFWMQQTPREQLLCQPWSHGAWSQGLHQNFLNKSCSSHICAAKFCWDEIGITPLTPSPLHTHTSTPWQNTTTPHNVNDWNGWVLLYSVLPLDFHFLG